MSEADIWDLEYRFGAWSRFQGVKYGPWPRPSRSFFGPLPSPFPPSPIFLDTLGRSAAPSHPRHTPATRAAEVRREGAQCPREIFNFSACGCWWLLVALASFSLLLWPWPCGCGGNSKAPPPFLIYFICPVWARPGVTAARNYSFVTSYQNLALLYRT